MQLDIELIPPFFYNIFVDVFVSFSEISQEKVTRKSKNCHSFCHIHRDSTFQFNHFLVRCVLCMIFCSFLLSLVTICNRINCRLVLQNFRLYHDHIIRTKPIVTLEMINLKKEKT